MNIVKSMVKRQVLIPAPIRKKYHIGENTLLRVHDEGTRIVIKPVKIDPIKEGRWMPDSKGRVLKALITDRKRESER